MDEQRHAYARTFRAGPRMIPSREGRGPKKFNRAARREEMLDKRRKERRALRHIAGNPETYRQQRARWRASRRGHGRDRAPKLLEIRELLAEPRDPKKKRGFLAWIRDKFTRKTREESKL